MGKGGSLGERTLFTPKAHWKARSGLSIRVNYLL